MRLAGKAALITGASSGIGRASALRFAREGALVLIASHDDAPCHALVREIEAAGGTASFQHTDVSRRADTERAIDVCVERYGGIDILFCNAGVTSPMLLTDSSDDEIDRVLSINLVALMHAARYAIPSCSHSPSAAPFSSPRARRDLSRRRIRPSIARPRAPSSCSPRHSRSTMRHKESE